MMNCPLRCKVICLGVAIAIGTPGCAPKQDRLAYDNFTQIRTQVHTRDDVEALLGEPDHRLGDRFMYERPDKHLHVFVEFDEQGRVARTQWIDGLGEAWRDTDDAKAHKPPGQ